MVVAGASTSAPPILPDTPGNVAVDWTARMPAPYEVTYTHIESLSAALYKSQVILAGSADYNFERRILHKLVYRNVSQHRRGVAFQWVRRLQRTLTHADNVGASEMLRRLGSALPSAPSSVKTLQLPTYPTMCHVLTGLVRVCRLIKAAMGMCTRVFEVCCADLGAALFMPLHLTCAAAVSRLAVLLSSHLDAAIAAYKAIALCTTWSTVPLVRRGGNSTARSEDSLFSKLPVDIDAHLATAGGGTDWAILASGGDTMEQQHVAVTEKNDTVTAAQGVVISRLDFKRRAVSEASSSTIQSPSSLVPDVSRSAADASVETPPDSPLAQDALSGLSDVPIMEVPDLFADGTEHNTTNDADASGTTRASTPNIKGGVHTQEHDRPRTSLSGGTKRESRDGDTSAVNQQQRSKKMRRQQGGEDDQPNADDNTTARKATTESVRLATVQKQHTNIKQKKKKKKKQNKPSTSELDDLFDF